MSTCTNVAASELQYELLLRTGNGWTPAGRYHTFHGAILAAMRAKGQFIIDNLGRRRPPVRRA